MNKINKILAATSHRQYPLPEKKWKYFQQWHDTLFLHWRVPKSLLEDYIPKELELDITDDTAWVSLLAFDVKNMRLRNLPSIPYLLDFQEINLRTYVIKDGIPGIYFFSIEADKLIEVLLTRFFIGLPYKKSCIKRTLFHIWSSNKNADSYLDVKYSPPRTIKKTPLDLWLTERHALYQNYDDKMCRFDIHHKEWKLNSINTKVVNIKYKAGSFALTAAPDEMHYCKKLNVVLWEKKRYNKHSHCGYISRKP